MGSSVQFVGGVLEERQQGFLRVFSVQPMSPDQRDSVPFLLFVFHLHFDSVHEILQHLENGLLRLFSQLSFLCQCVLDICCFVVEFLEDGVVPFLSLVAFDSNGLRNLWEVHFQALVDVFDGIGPVLALPADLLPGRVEFILHVAQQLGLAVLPGLDLVRHHLQVLVFQVRQLLQLRFKVEVPVRFLFLRGSLQLVQLVLQTRVLLSLNLLELVELFVQAPDFIFDIIQAVNSLVVLANLLI